MLDITLVVLSVTFMQGDLVKATTDEITGFKSLEHCEFVRMTVQNNYNKYLENSTIDGKVKEGVVNLISMNCVQNQDI